MVEIFIATFLGSIIGSSLGVYVATKQFVKQLEEGMKNIHFEALYVI